MNKLVLIFLSIFFNTVFALQNDAKQSIEIEADSAVINERQGLSIYTGKVKFKQGSLMLNAEKIQLFSTQTKVTKLIATGTTDKLAQYQQSQPNQPRFIQANARNIVYLIEKELIHLKGNARLIQGFDSFSGATLDYDIKNDKVIVKQSKDGMQRVRFKIKL